VDLGAAPLIVSRYVRDLAPGSHVAITAACTDGLAPEVIRAAERIYAGSSAPIIFRTHAQVEELFDGLTLLPPGIQDVYWSDNSRMIGGIAVK
jgi:S-adenosyl methyltransferase